MTEIGSTVDRPERRVPSDAVHAWPAGHFQSVAAFVYYRVGPVGTLSKGAGAFGVDPIYDLVPGSTVALIAADACPGIRQLRRNIHEEGADR